MSRFSGKCDLYDDISMNGGADDFENFEIFKKKTGGVIQQFVHDFKLTDFNVKYECQHNSSLQMVEHKRVVPDKRFKSGTRTIIDYTYQYLGKDYNTLDELNKVYFKTKNIYFDNILDIIPYFPYIIGLQFSDPNQTHIVISTESYVDSEENSLLMSGCNPEHMTKVYRKNLADYYVQIINDPKFKK